MVEWYFLNETVLKWHLELFDTFIYFAFLWILSSEDVAHIVFQILWTAINDEMTFLVVHHGINELRGNDDLWSDLKPIIKQPEYNRTNNQNMCCNSWSINGKQTCKDETSFCIRFVESHVFRLDAISCRQANYQGVSNVIVAAWMQKN